MKRRGKARLTTPKEKMPRRRLRKQSESEDSEEEERLVVPKVIRQYTRKKVDSTESVKKPAYIPSIKIGATWSEQSNSMSLFNNHVEVKEEITGRYPVIEIIDVDESENHIKTEERSVLQNGVSNEDNSIKIKEENDNDSKDENVGINSELNCTNSKGNSNVTIKKADVSKQKGTIIYQILSNNIKNSTIKIKKENGSDGVVDNFNPTETVMQTEKTAVKIEHDDNLQFMNSDQKHVSLTDDSQSETKPVFKTRQENEKNPCNSLNTSNKAESSCNENYVKNISIKNPQQSLQTIQRKILITEEIDIKEEVIEINCKEVKKKPPVVKKTKEQVVDKEPVVEKVNLKRIINMPRLLRTYSRKQPEVPPPKKIFMVAVNNPFGKTKKKLSPEQMAKIRARTARAKLLVCDMCNRNFRSKASVSGHMRFVHRVAMRYKCEKCPASFPHYYQWLAHVRNHAGRPLACDLCPKQFKHKDKYAEHLNTHLRERLFPCPVCLRRYTILPHLQRHAERHSPGDTFPCATCNEIYRSIIDLSRHSERDHGEKVEFPCYVCNRICNSNAEFVTHVKTHDNVMFPCAFCPRRFDDAQKWEEHSNEHIGKIGNGETQFKPYPCEYCNKSFEFQSTLITHIRIHTGERPYECPECSKKLKTQSALTEHINGHKKPFPCPECNRYFGKRDSLSRHILLHTGERPHACTGCSLTFVQRSAMKQHMRRFHEPGLKRDRKLKKKNVKKSKKK